MKYIRLQDNIVVEIIPNEATIPNIETWYGKEFALQCMEVSDNIEIGMIYNLETKSFINKDKIKISEQIFNLKNEITRSDYKIIKCYEYSLAGITNPPYDISILHTERELIRNEINTLEQLLVV